MRSETYAARSRSAHTNLARSGALAVNRDFEALGSLVVGLEKIAGMDLRQAAIRPPA